MPTLSELGTIAKGVQVPETWEDVPTKRNILRRGKKQMKKPVNRILEDAGTAVEELHRTDPLSDFTNRLSKRDWKNITQRETEITRSNRTKRGSEAAAGVGATGLGLTAATAYNKGHLKRATSPSGTRHVQLGIPKKYERPLAFEKPARRTGISTNRPITVNYAGNQLLTGKGPREVHLNAPKFKGRASMPYAAALGTGALLTGGGLAGSAGARIKRRYNEHKIADMRKGRFEATGKKVGPGR